MATEAQFVLHIDVQLLKGERRQEVPIWLRPSVDMLSFLQIEQALSVYIRRRFTYLPTLQSLDVFDDFEHHEEIKSISFGELEGTEIDRLMVPAKDVRVSVHLFHPDEQNAARAMALLGEHDETAQDLDMSCLVATSLPIADMDGEWDE
ncbi:hypothetical protein ANO11243_072630 [Dothideomycetidae sp. 11243]|nr:hypothetical protein ANO11243_072630 [fungal sp. No.11243]